MRVCVGMCVRRHVLGTGSEYLTESGLEEVVFELSGSSQSTKLACIHTHPWILYMHALRW